MFPFSLFKKKRVEPTAEQEQSSEEKTEAKPDVATGNPMLDMELAKIKAQLDSASEMRKATSERFSQISEQIGGLRAMIVDIDKNFSQLEVKASRAVDMVEIVQPDKLMIDMQKLDGKIDALKANLESNETIMKAITDELKDIRLKIGLFKGVEQVMKMLDDTKADLMNVKKVDMNIERHADKVETIFSDFQKSYSEYRKINDDVRTIIKSAQDLTSSVDTLKVKVSQAAMKKEYDVLVAKFSDFEKHVGNVMDLLEKKSSELPDELKNRFERLESEYRKLLDRQYEKTGKLLKLVESIERKYPEEADRFKTFEMKDAFAQANPPQEAPKAQEISPAQQPTPEAQPAQPQQPQQAQPAQPQQTPQNQPQETKKQGFSFGFNPFKKKESAAKT